MTLVFMIFSAFVPLFVYLKPVLLDDDIQILFSGIKYAPDFFSYYKSLLIIVSAALGLTLFFYQKKHKNLKLNKINYLIIIYIVLIIFSTILSDHIKIALFGFYNLYEGCFVLISYLLILYFSSLLDDYQIKVVLYSIIVSTTIICMIGIGQFLGFDIFRTNFFRALTMPTKFMEISHMLEVKIDKYSIYSTLLNPNYVGSYMAMLFPFSIGLFVCSNKKNIKIFFGFLSVLIFLNLLGSGSKAGYLGASVGMVLLFGLLKNSLKYVKNQLLILAITLIASSFIMFITVKGTLPEKLQMLYNSDIGNLETEKIVKDLKYVDNGIQIETYTETMKVLLVNSEISFFDDSNQYMNLIEENNNIKIDDSRFRDYIINFLPKDNIVLLNNGDTKFRLIAIPEYGIRLLSYKGEVITNLEVEKFGFNDKEKFASSRGYIWSRAIPMLKNTIIIGHGPDNFVLYFPQNDMVGKYKIYGTDEMLVNKPHSMYLQIAINTGLFSLVCFLSIIFIYTISTIKSINKDEISSDNKIIKACIFVSIVSYLIAGIFNDSMVGVAPVFWTLLGIGLNINFKSSNEFFH